MRNGLARSTTHGFSGSQLFLQGMAQYTRSLTVNVDEVTDHIMSFLIGRYDGIIEGDRGYAYMKFLMSVR